jgi:hypothetical protein
MTNVQIITCARLVCDRRAPYVLRVQGEPCEQAIENQGFFWPGQSTLFPPQAAKLLRTRDKTAFPTGALFAGRGLVDEWVDFTGRHIGCQARASLAALARGRGAGECRLHQPANGLWTARLVRLSVSPSIDGGGLMRQQPDHDRFGANRRPTPAAFFLILDIDFLILDIDRAMNN